jgi:hypothetical protein
MLKISFCAEAFHGLRVITKAGVLSFAIYDSSRDGKGTTPYAAMDAAGTKLHVPIHQFTELPKRVSKVAEKLYKLFLSCDPTIPKKEVEWILNTSRVIFEYYLKSIHCCGMKMRTRWRDLDFSFGLDNITDLNSFKSAVKSSLVWPSAAITNNSAAPVIPFKGPSREYFKRLFRTKVSMRKLALVQTLLIGVKKVAPAMPTSQVRTNEDGCIARYRLPPRQTDDEINCALRQAQYILKGFDFTLPERIQNFSLRANLDASRADYGSYGEAMRRFGMADSSKVSNGCVRHETGLAAPTVEELLSEVAELEFNLAWPFSDEPPCVFKFTDERSLRREVVGLPEPLKVRAISLNEWWESPLWGPLQQSLMGHLKKKPYVCSGKELPPEFFNTFASAVTEAEIICGVPFIIVSDDGDAATDSICLKLSNLSIRDIVPDELKAVYDKCSGFTGECIVRVRDVKHPDAPWFQQANSQLMGDRLSFVKLTVIHSSWKLEFFRRIQRIYGLSWELIHRLFLVNGDDGVVALPENLVDDYLSWMSRLWNINPVKTQISRNIFTINSRMFRVGSRTVREVPFFRWNLVERVDKSGGLVVNPQVWNEFSETAAPLMPHDLLWNMFHRKWSGTLQLLTKGKGNNYFLPALVGGLGMVPLPGMNFKYTSRQRLAVEIVSRRINKEGPPPVFMTRVVPIIKHLDGWGETKVLVKTGIIRGKNKVEDASIGTLKGVCKATKLYTYKLPDGNSDYPVEGSDNLSYGIITTRSYHLENTAPLWSLYFEGRFSSLHY